MKYFTIKARIMLLCTLLAAATALLALGVMMYNEEKVVDGYFRDSLAATAQLAKDEVRIEDGKLKVDRNLDDLPTVRVVLYTEDGDLLFGRQSFELPFAADEIREIHNESGAHWIVQDTKMILEDASALWLRCYIPVDAMDSVQGVRGEVLLVMLPALILLAELGGWLIARRAFWPIKKIIRTAEGIAGGADLKKRIALKGAKDEIYQTAECFDAMLDRLEAAFERERRFTADASHELRTPVAAIMAQSEYALSDDANDQDRREALLTIRQTGGRMAELISGLLSLSRLEAKQALEEREEFDLGAAAEVAADMLRERAQQRGISIETARCEPAVLCGDQTMVTQAVLNLVENAVRYGSEGGQVRIGTAQSGGECRLWVEDDGPGIAPEDQKRIFDRFYQIDASRSSQGFGLGLSLVKRIAQLHGGRVELSSVPGRGSRFELIFPKEDAHA